MDDDDDDSLQFSGFLIDNEFHFLSPSKLPSAVVNSRRGNNRDPEQNQIKFTMNIIIHLIVGKSHQPAFRLSNVQSGFEWLQMVIELSAA